MSGKDRFHMEEAPVNVAPVFRRTSVQSRTPQRATSSVDHPVKIVYQSGREELLAPEMVAILDMMFGAVAKPRTGTGRRFWRLKAANDSRMFFTDEEILDMANRNGLRASNPVEAAKAMNFVAKFFIVDETGRPIVENGDWVEARSDECGAYRPASSGDTSTT